MTGPGEGWHLGFLNYVSDPWNFVEGKTSFLAFYEI